MASDDYGLALDLWQRGAPDRAGNAVRRLLAADPASADGHQLLGAILMQQRRYAAARASLRRATLIAPEDAVHHANLAGALARDDLEARRAEQGFRRALACRPDFAEAQLSYGNMLRRGGRWADALPLHSRATRCRPGFAPALAALGRSLLALGCQDDGWAAIEAGLYGEHASRLPETFWRGEPVDGRTVLVHGAEHVWETLLLARYLPCLARRGATVIVHLPDGWAPLAAVIGRIAGVRRVLVGAAPAPAFDVHVPFAALPHRFGASHEPAFAIPGPGRADSAPAARPGRVGLAWRADTPSTDRGASALELAPLLAVPGIEWTSLRLGGNGLDGLDEIAAAMPSLDLVIAADDTMAHLAGALGVLTWVLLAHAAEWCWMTDREDSPWYPALHLFRQPAPGDWATPVHRMAAELETLFVM
ncbi:MAG TPA: tetratricopeptide repeat protein [Azospirillum sp.]|nr:tetratricopeptide repeat protein [Azospirillum sp.]